MHSARTHCKEIETARNDSPTWDRNRVIYGILWLGHNLSIIRWNFTLILSERVRSGFREVGLLKVTNGWVDCSIAK